MKRVIFTIFMLLFVGCANKTTTTLNVSNKAPTSLSLANKAPAILNLEYEQNASILSEFKLNLDMGQKEFLDKLFSVWQMKSIKEKKSDLMWAFNAYNGKKQYFGESKLPRNLEWFSYQKQNANFDELGTVFKPAITLSNTLIRNFPTNDKLFLDPKKAGEGYPFDYLQDSVIGAFHPVMISHFSKDRAFAFVKSDALWGFVPSKNLKILSKKEVDEFKKYNFGVFVKDNASILDDNGKFMFYSRLGGIFPYTDENTTHFKFNNKFAVDKKYAKKFQSINNANLKNTLNELLGQNYGWGGENYLRDCSLFIKDFFGSFGIWLPRNSKEQGKIGQMIDLKNLSNKEKKEIISKVGLPFLSLLYMPGHIMIYGGEVDGKLVSIHDAWGIRTKDGGRAMIGKVAITDLEIGKGYDNIDEKSLLLSKITSLNTIIDKNILSLQKAYSIKVIDNVAIFEDGSSMIYDDGVKKDFKALLKNPSIKDMFSLDYNALKPLDEELIDAGRIRNSEFFSKLYGKNKEEVISNLVDVVWLKDSVNKKIKFNAKFGAAASLQKVSDELNELIKKDPNLLKYIDNIAGTFNYRNIAKTDQLSAHSWGIAIDINVANSHYWQWHKKYKNLIPKEIVYVFEKNGFIWGGRWEHFDTMHFEYRPELMGDIDY
ncbi:bifunctional C40 family peptidase/M15 family metallopeptidase [Campylobacter hyointestinalis]|uniref:Glycoside hydrolase n=1 Tax=Campylobacter hyointestinalis subsp. lawsonii TaxID=91353 RepID=A0AAV6EFT4_CAMHY|nr:M15 family metallopeptidase [Campylobacter hyointestinalis]KAB0612507.1 glycoside hydrolase [Campylobacter hyointestinalis subsp. lawsonii]QKF68960.1 putative D-alanyl-D-alanine carboxypeptidase, NlpC/P60 family lipoprotein (SH3b1, SH3b2 type SH3 domains) [Campylobacter hyointestinalis subsp. lawsonii]RAZ29469.1 glycoside hydrolase [Campylobacter hyointestinalis subsp. lawsonii]